MATATATSGLRKNAARLAQLAADDLAAVWRAVGEGQAAEPLLREVLPALVETYGAAAASEAADWYDNLRAAKGMPGSFTAIPADIPDNGVHALISWAIKTATDDAALKTLIDGGVQRRIADHSRLTVTSSSVADPSAEGWVRIGFGECDWCQQYIDGEVRSVAYDFPAHDHCNCSAVPAFDEVAAEQSEPELEPEEEYVEKIGKMLESGQVTESDLLAALSDPAMKPLSRVNIEAALARNAAKEQVSTADLVSAAVDPDAFLSQSQYDALIPEGAWSAEKRDAILSALRETPEGKILADTLERFQDGGSIARLRTKIDKYLAGEVLDATSRARVEALLNAIRYAPEGWAPETLYRGMTVKGSLENVLAKYTVGDDLALNLTSFSTDRKIATKFQQMTAKGGRETRVMVELVGPGKHALPIQNLPADRRLFREKEWVTGGRYEIVSVKKSGGGILLRIRQVGTV